MSSEQPAPRRAEIVPFGKYRGQPIEAMAQDKDYCDWLAGQDWFRTRFAGIHTLIVNNFGAPSETPEHNALQARFTDDAFVKAFVVAAAGPERLRRWLQQDMASEAARWKEQAEDVTSRVAGYRSSLERNRAWLTAQPIGGSDSYTRREIQRAEESLAKALVEAEGIASGAAATAASEVDVSARVIAFEDEGADVRLKFSPNANCGGWREMRVECKPGLGDDYPAVLRQMKASKCSVLLVGAGGYTGSGATLEQVRAIFASSSIRIVLLADIGEVS